MVEWSAKGNSFFVIDVPKFKGILTRYFKTCKLASFVRQLNMYSFHKLKNERGYQEFKHPLFKRGGFKDLESIHRKISVSYKSAKPQINAQSTEANPVSSLKTELSLVQRQITKTRYRKMQLIKINNVTEKRLMADKLALTANISKLLLVFCRHFLDHDKRNCFTKNNLRTINKNILLKLKASLDFQSPRLSSRKYFFNEQKKFHDQLNELIDSLFNASSRLMPEATGVHKAKALPKPGLKVSGGSLEYREVQPHESSISPLAVDKLEYSSVNVDDLNVDKSLPSELALIEQVMCFRPEEMNEEDANRQLN